jgi:hypothetical protein
VYGRNNGYVALNCRECRQAKSQAAVAIGTHPALRGSRYPEIRPAIRFCLGRVRVGVDSLLVME